MNSKTFDYLLVLARVTLGAIFFLAGAFKIPYAMDFAHNIAGYQILPYRLNVLAAATLPWMECLAALLLILGIRPRAAALLVTAFMTLFLFAMLSALLRGLEIDCGCFQVGKSDTPTPLWMSFLRDLGFMALCWVVLWGYHKKSRESAQTTI